MLAPKISPTIHPGIFLKIPPEMSARIQQIILLVPQLDFFPGIPPEITAVFYSWISPNM